MKKIDGHVRYLVDNGLIFEINRKVLHPLGLSLDVGIHPENSKWLAIHGVMATEADEPEGFVYDDESFKVGNDKFNEFLKRERRIDFEARRNKYGFIEQTEKSPIADSVFTFHFNGGKDQFERGINDYLNVTAKMMDRIEGPSSHNFIQWMFPNREPSPINTLAPVLTDSDIESFQEEYSQDDHIGRMKVYYDWFIDFIDDPEIHNEIFGNSSNHNHLRITRVIKFFMETGFEQYASKLFEYCKESIREDVDMDLALSYWEDAMGIEE